MIEKSLWNKFKELNAQKACKKKISTPILISIFIRNTEYVYFKGFWKYLVGLVDFTEL